jgi:serine/threonine-protein kinase
MRQSRWRRVKEVFHGALEREAGERPAFLDRACAGDGMLRCEVESLLAAEDRPLPWLDGPVFEVAADMLARDPAAPLAGRRLGPWKLLREIGSGGMGTVYLAERADRAFEQQVAVKLLKRGMDSDDILRRFRQERQILASLDHPNIARLLDGGVTADGASYFVMEHIEGVPIDDYCRRNRLPVEERLELFATVCAAVHSAHRSLVVHCDLKPSNILVTSAGAPKLLDFGIAKLLGSEHVPLLTATALTRPQMLTPEYASPEHLRGERITTASDVYSLGVLLYALLTGRLPYRFASRAPGEIERVVCEDEPPKPSTAVAEDTDRGRERDLRRRLAGDLDTIVLRAMDKDPVRRYGSVEQLAEDLRRHRDGRPVIARKDTWLYRAGKFVKRHRVGTLAAALVAISLLAGIVATSWQAREARAQREKARLQQQAAEQVAGLLAGLLHEADPFGLSGEALTVRELLDQGARQIEGALADQPQVRARMMDTIGVAYMNLGIYDRALPLLDEALASRRRVLGEEAPEVAESLAHLGSLWYEKGDLEAAAPLLRQALSMRSELLGERSPEVAESLDHLGSLLRDAGDYSGAEPLVREALALRRELLGEEAPEVATSLHNLALLLLKTGEYPEAEDFYRRALELNRRLFGQRHPKVATNLHNLGGVLRLRGEYEDSERCLREALALHRELLGDEHPYAAAVLNTLAVLLKDKGDHPAAERTYREVLDLQRRQLGAEHPAVARTVSNLAASLAGRGEHAAAEPLYREALDLYRRVLGDRHPEVANTLNHLGVLHYDRGDAGGAVSYLRQALELRRELLGPEHPSVAISLLDLGRVLTDRGDLEEAEPLLREGLRIREQKLAADHWRTANARSLLGACLTALGRYREAEPLLLDGYRTLAAQRGADHPQTSAALDRVVALYEAWGRTAQAERYRAYPSPGPPGGG